MQTLAHIPYVDRLYIPHLFHIGEVKIGHADLLPLIQERRPPQRQQQRCQRLGALVVVFGIIAVAGNRPGLIVVFEVDGIPRQRILPLGQAGKKAVWLKLPQKPLDLKAVCLHVLKGKYGTKFLPLRVHQVIRHFGGNKYRFPHRKGIITGQHIPVQAMQHPVASRGGKIIFTAGKGRAPPAVFYGLLVDDIDNVTAEPGHAAVQPKAHHILNGRYHLFVVIVEVGLLLGKQVEIILPSHLVIFPAVLPEEAAPVGRLFALFPFSPNVKIGIRLLPAAALLEPLMPVAGVVDDQVHDNADIPLFRFGDEPIHIRQRTVVRVDLTVIADIIAVILIGGWIHRRKPQRPYPQSLQVVQPGDDPGQVADAVAV